MFNRSLLFLLFFFLLAYACTEKSSSKDKHTSGGRANEGLLEEETTYPDRNAALRGVDPAMVDYFCVPGKNVGKITPSFTEKQLIETYGADNVIREEIGFGEGESVPGTIVFPDSTKELVVYWLKEYPYEKIAKIRIDKEGGPWKTITGIQVGTSLEQLEKINGKPFNFYGFEWDYSGLVENWNEGNISDELQVFLEPGNPEAVIPELLGDREFPSTHPNAVEGKLRVSSMVFFFSHEPIE
jgi:hypothetical protein